MFNLLKKLVKNENTTRISFLDVKELYDAAYAEKANARVNIRRFHALMEQAVQMDQAYRAQLLLEKNISFPYSKAA